MEEFVRKNPWLGLESYKEGEILYGRDDDIRDLSQCVLNDADTLLYGKSGIGKSSILNAGILPAARRNGYLPVLIRLSHKEKQSYLHQINQAILNAILHSLTGDFGTDVSITNGDYALNDAQSLIREVVSCKDTEAESFYEYFHRHTFHNANGDRLKLLIIFDQFEEIFTLQDDVQKKKNFFTHLADLLNDIMPDELQQKVEISSDTQEEIIVGDESDFENIFDDLNLGVENSLPEYVTDNDVHFVFTIREDFLSEFEYYSAAIPSLKQNRYGLRPINEEQAAQIILRPVPELIDESVAKLIIEKITGKNDFKIDGVPEIEVDSAVLSLYLNRLYEAKEGKTITKELVEQKGGEIISDFYNDALSDISDSTIEYLEDMLLNGQGRRDNITVYDAINDGNISERELDILCNKKKILRQFNYAGDLRIEYVHDILCPIVERNKAERRIVAEEKSQNKKLKDLRRQRSITLLGIIILLMCIVFYVIGFHIPISERYASTTKQWGCFVGIESLSKKDALFRPYHFVLKKKGLFAKTYISMECRDRFNNLSTSHGISPYIVIGQMEDSVLADGIKGKLQMVCKWEFIKDPVDKDLVIQERAYDKNDNLVYAFNYNAPQVISQEEHTSKNSQNNSAPEKQHNESLKGMSIIGSYVDGQGLPLELMMEGYRFIRITYDDNGRDMLVEYFDWDGNPSTNADGAYQTYYEYDDIGQCISMSSLNMYGKRMIDHAGNCGQISKYDGYRIVEILSVDEFGREKAVKDGYSRVMYEYDNNGREIMVSLWNEDGPVCPNSINFHIRRTLYDDAKNSLEQRCYNTKEELINLIEIRFDTKGNILYYSENANGKNTIQNSRYNKKNECVFQDEITIEGGDTIGIFNYEKVDNIETKKFRGRIYNEYINKVTYDSKNRVIEDVYYELDSEIPYSKKKYVYTNNGRKVNDRYYQTLDSVINYRNDTLYLIEEYKRYPNIYYNRCIEYSPLDSSIYEYRIDQYNNFFEVCVHNHKIYRFTNAKTNELNDNSVAILSRYNYPVDTLSYLTLNTSNRCDENGDTAVSANYLLPEIYSGQRDKKAFFIECLDNGRRWHSVILGTSQGMYYGADDYLSGKFEQDDILLCLNLRTMQVEDLSLQNLDFWEIYGFKITKQEDSLYRDYYYKSIIKECTLDPKDEWYNNWYRVQNFASYINNTRLRTRNINIRTLDCIPDTLLKNDMYKLLTSYKQYHPDESGFIESANYFYNNLLLSEDLTGGCIIWAFEDNKKHPFFNVGDIVIKYNGEPVYNKKGLKDLYYNKSKTATVTFLRLNNGKFEEHQEPMSDVDIVGFLDLI